MPSSRADLAEELRDLAAELLALRFQGLRGATDIVGGGRRGGGVRVDPPGGVGDVLGALRRMLRAARNLLRGGALFLHRRGDRGGDLVDLANDAADALDGVDGL